VQFHLRLVQLIASITLIGHVVLRPPW